MTILQSTQIEWSETLIDYVQNSNANNPGSNIRKVTIGRCLENFSNMFILEKSLDCYWLSFVSWKWTAIYGTGKPEVVVPFTRFSINSNLFRGIFSFDY